MRKIKFFVILSAILLLVTGCGKTEPASQEPEKPTESGTSAETELVDPIVILEKDGTKIGQIDNRASATAVQNGIFYSVTDMAENAYVGTAEYHFFSLEDKRDVLLGKLENQGYEAQFTRTELNGVIYTLAIEGDPYNDPSVTLLLLAFDPQQKTMKRYTVTKYGFPYTSIAVLDGDLLIMNHEMSKDKAEKIYRFHPDTEKIEEVLSFDSGRDSLRAVTAAEDGFYVLRLRLNSGSENELYLDHYDKNFAKTAERKLSDLLAAAVMEVHGVANRQEAMNELGMIVSRFAVLSGRYLVYENFGLTRVIVDLENGGKVFSGDDHYSASVGTGEPVLFRLDFDPDHVEAPEILEIRDGALAKVPFEPADSHKMIQGVSRSASGTWAVYTTDNYPFHRGTQALTVWSE